VIVDVLLFGYRTYAEPLNELRLNVVHCEDFENAAAEIIRAEGVKVLLFDRWIQGGAGYDLARILRATHRRSFVGQSLPAVMFVKPKEEGWTFIDRSKPLPGKMDFLLGEPFTAADIAEIVSRYDNGEGGPPADWTGWFREPEEDYQWPGLRPQDPEVFAWEQDALVEEIRRWLTPENFDAWFLMVKPGIEKRLRWVQNQHDAYHGTGAPTD